MRRVLPSLLILALAVPALAVNTQDVRAALAEAKQALAAGKTRAARQSALAALEEDPKSSAAHELLAQIYLRQGNGLTAEQHVRRAIASGQKPTNLRHLLGHALFLQGKLREGFLEVTTADVPPAHRGEAMRIKGKIHVAAGEMGYARESYDTAIAAGSDTSILWSDIARFRFIAGDLAGAADAVDRALKRDERNVEALILTGEIARGQYGLVAAIGWFQRAVEVDPGSSTALLELAATQGDAGRTRDMLATVRKLLTIEGKNPRAFYLLAVLAARAGKYDLSRALLYRTNERIDDVPGVMLLRALLDIQQNNDTQAIIRLKKLVEIQPGNLKARRLLGAALIRSGDNRSAIDVLRPMAMRADADTYTLTLAGRAYEQLDQRQESVWFLERAARPERGDATPFEIPVSLGVLARANAENPNNADAAVPFITQLVANGQAGQALAEAERLARFNPGAPAAHVLVGDALAAQRRYGDAVQAYKDAANIRFSEGTALRLIKALGNAGRQDEALKTLDLFLSQNPESIAGRVMAAEYFMLSGQWDKAIATLEGLRKRLGNRDATILNNLSWAWLNKGDQARAISYARAAYAITPANPATANTYGWTMFQTGYDRSFGVALLEKAARKMPNNAGMQLRLAQAYAKLGRKNDARRALKTVLAAPDSPDRRMARELIAKL